MLENVPFFPEKWLFHLRRLSPSSPLIHFYRQENWGLSIIPWDMSPMAHQEMLSVLMSPPGMGKEKIDEIRPLFSDGYVFLVPFLGIDPENPATTVAIRYRTSIIYDHRTCHLFVPDLLYESAKKAGCWDVEESSGSVVPGMRLFPGMLWEQYRQKVLKVLSGIDQGLFYQLNLAIDFRGEDPGIDPVVLNHDLLNSNPSPGSAMLSNDGGWLVSNSPERLFSLSGGMITTSPIAGTLPVGKASSLNESLKGDLLGEELFKGDPKEHAEHIMTVDLLRNDLGKICRGGTIHVPRLLGVERYRHLWHLVSDVRGELCAETGLGEILAAMMPGGSVTGAPKRAVTKGILELEEYPREYYCGSLGLFDPETGSADFNLLIRTVFQKNGHIRIPVGSGLVADSDPQTEYEEILAKLRVISDVLGNGLSG
jgi:anthranilate/para-aminobenzoate synthase component I